MLTDLDNYDDPSIPYKIDKVKGQIGYKLHDEISYSMTYGHKTTFTYFRARDNGDISDQVLRSRVGFLSLFAARFSYAKIPSLYTLTMGLTGTLQSLSLSQKAMFALSDLDQYFVKIKELICELTRKGRAVIVFFDNTARIDAFKQSEYFDSTRNLLLEESLDKAALFRAATGSGQCTISAKAFGRGTDFVCHDERVQNAGGVVVIQTFFSFCTRSS